MKDEFEFNKIGKRMPYAVPDGFFDEMEQRLREELGHASRPLPNPRKRNKMIPFVVGALTVAAVVVWAFVLIPREENPDSASAIELAEVEQAFGNLAMEDQAYMLSVYEECLSINE